MVLIRHQQRSGATASGGPAPAGVVHRVLGDGLPVAVRTWDGARSGPADAPATIVVRGPEAIARVLRRPGQLGLARAYVAGDIDVEGDVFAVLDLPASLGAVRPTAAEWAALARLAGRTVWRRLPPPPEEARLKGRRHSPERDRAAVTHHYDVSNDFYRVILGPSMTYSCARWGGGAGTLEEAQEAKHALVASKLGVGPGVRLLDVGCGWGAMVEHAARAGADAVGVTLSASQHAYATRRLGGTGVAGRARVRVEDYRSIGDGPYDAVCSIGMSEHVGEAELPGYFRRLAGLLRPGGRLVNHAISALPAGRVPASWPAPVPLRRWKGGARFAPDSFVERYVFPDGELVEVGKVVSAAQQAGLEVRHVETLREHYGLTLRRWLANLEAGWDAAVAAAGPRRARAWRLYLAGSARSFETGRIGVHQVLAVKPDAGRSGFGLRPSFG